MIGDLGVGYVRAERCRHVASGAIRLRRVMLGPLGFTVAYKTFFAVIGDTLFCRRRRMWIVTTGARHGFAAFSFAFALPQGLYLGDRTQTLLFCAGEDVMADIVRKQVSGTKVITMPPGALDGYVAFEVAFHADGIPPRR